VNTEQKYRNLQEIISSLQNVVVAFSGGVDSTFLLKVCVDVLGRKNVLAFIGQSPTCPVREIEEAKSLAALIGAKYVIEETTEMWQRSLTCRIPVPWRKSSEHSFFFQCLFIDCNAIGTGSMNLQSETSP
jgi:PP-loop superfamily ATP-utilizing enzyme